MTGLPGSSHSSSSPTSHFSNSTSLFYSLLKDYPFLVLFFSGSVGLATGLYYWHLQPWRITLKMSPQAKLSDKLYDLCRSPNSISSEYAKDPSIAPAKISHKLYGQHYNVVHEPPAPSERVPASEEELQRALECGKFEGTQPSKLFKQVWYDALKPLEGDHMVGCVSPSLMGGTGIVPLTVVGSIKDVCFHMANLIVKAEREVFLATNFWLNSDSSNLICNAIRELSRRAGKRGTKVVVKLMYDRGHIKQLVDNHTIVKSSEYVGRAVNLPDPEEIPHVDLEVQNYHRPLLGTFHCKFMVVDRRIGIVSSNNIQSNDNMEMGVQVEGPIVDGLWDLSLASWDKELNPPLPCHDLTATDRWKRDEVKGRDPGTFGEEYFRNLWNAEGKLNLKVLAEGVNPKKTGEEQEEKDKEPSYEGPVPHFDDDIAAEVARMQKSLNPGPGERKMDAVAKHLNQPVHANVKPTAPDCDPEEDFCPLIPHPPHKPFPIALVNRKPWGAPNHSCVFVPQNEAWLSAIRNATTTVFIQTPNLNASELLPELIDAVKRGVEVIYYVCLGYNDAGELLPLQGGTNEMVANSLYQKLTTPEEKERLKIYYYVGKDQDHPIHNKFKQRSCHIKLLIADSHLGIQGNGNQDTQSHFHSQETNILIDSHEVCTAWLDSIRRNQNTHIYGRCGEDGVWRDKEGNKAEGSIGNNPGKFAWAKGIKGAIERVRGAGGF